MTNPLPLTVVLRVRCRVGWMCWRHTQRSLFCYPFFSVQASSRSIFQLQSFRFSIRYDMCCSLCPTVFFHLYPCPENTHRWRKDHFTYGWSPVLQVRSQPIHYTYYWPHIFIFGLTKSCQSGDQLYNDPSPYGKCFLAGISVIAGTSLPLVKFR